MFPEARAARLAGLLCLISLACPAILAVVVVLLKSGAIRFHDDYYGFKGLGFLLGWGVVLLPLGTLAGAVALFIKRASWVARAAAGVNSLLLTGFLLLLARFFL